MKRARIALTAAVIVASGCDLVLGADFDEKRGATTATGGASAGTGASATTGDASTDATASSSATGAGGDPCQGDDYAACVLAAEPLAYFPFDEATTTTTEFVAEGPSALAVRRSQQGTIASASLIGPAVKLTDAGYVADVGNEVETYDALFLGKHAFTVEQWWLGIPATEGNNTTFFTFSGPLCAGNVETTGASMYLSPVDDKVFVYVQRNGCTEEDVHENAGIAQEIADVSAVHHVALTFDGTMMCLYLDGAAGSCKESVGDVKAFARFWITGYGTTTQSFTGTIDEIAFYPRALAPAEIVAHCQAGKRAAGVAVTCP